MQLFVKTLRNPKSKQTSPSTLTTAFTNEFMRKQKQIGLENYFKLDSITILTQ